MYDPAGMLVAMAAMGASKTQADTMSTKLNGGESLMAADVRVQAMKEAYAGRGDGGIETDGGWNEDVLWRYEGGPKPLSWHLNSEPKTVFFPCGCVASEDKLP